MKFHWLRARAFVHATEDEERVREALIWTIGQLGQEDAHSRVQRQRAKGHYGNEIVLLEATLKRDRDIDAALRHLVAEPVVRETVHGSLLRRLDEDNVLHVRVDKQAAVGRRLVLAEGSDSFVVTVKAMLHGGELAAPAWARYLSEPAAVTSESSPK